MRCIVPARRSFVYPAQEVPGSARIIRHDEGPTYRITKDKKVSEGVDLPVLPDI